MILASNMLFWWKYYLLIKQKNASVILQISDRDWYLEIPGYTESEATSSNYIIQYIAT